MFSYWSHNYCIKCLKGLILIWFHRISNLNPCTWRFHVFCHYLRTGLAGLKSQYWNCDCLQLEAASRFSWRTSAWLFVCDFCFLLSFKSSSLTKLRLRDIYFRVFSHCFYSVHPCLFYMMSLLSIRKMSGYICMYPPTFLWVGLVTPLNNIINLVWYIVLITM